MSSIRCASCGRFCRRTGRRQKYCSVCREVVAYIKQREWAFAHGFVGKLGVGSGGNQHPEKYPNWRGGATKFRRHRKVACERCGSTRFLCAHHRDRNRDNGAADNIETLCKSCHQKEHEVYRNYLVGMNAARRKMFSRWLIHLNKTLPRINGKNASRRF